MYWAPCVMLWAEFSHCSFLVADCIKEPEFLIKVSIPVEPENRAVCHVSGGNPYGSCRRIVECR